jgi:hypothetical protein
VAYGAAAFAPDRWRRVVTLGVPPLALDTRIFADYDQLKRLRPGDPDPHLRLLLLDRFARSA